MKDEEWLFMCGRYEFSLAEPSLRALWETARQRFPQAQMETGEIFPSELAAVLLGAGTGCSRSPRAGGSRAARAVW